MKGKVISVVVSMILVGFISIGSVPQEVRAQSGDGDQETGPQSQYEPSPAFPYGRLNPAAPPELAQFEFMIGEFDCIDSIRPPDGSRVSFPAIWNAHYFLNGMGVQDQYWSPNFSTSNIRIFDPDAERWKITFFRMPGYQSGVWEGVMEGDQLVFRNNGRTSGPGLTFYNLRADGFD